MDDRFPIMASQIKQDSNPEYSNLKDTAQIRGDCFGLVEDKTPEEQYDNSMQKAALVEKSASVAKILDRMSRACLDSSPSDSKLTTSSILRPPNHIQPTASVSLQGFKGDPKKTIAQASPRYSIEHGGVSTSQSTEAIASGAPELDSASKLLKEFLLKNSTEFVRVNEYREKVTLVPIVIIPTGLTR